MSATVKEVADGVATIEAEAFQDGRRIIRKGKATAASGLNSGPSYNRRDALIPSGAVAGQGGRPLRRGRAARRLQGARLRRGDRLRLLDHPQRARGARGAGAARPSAHLGGARADGRRLPLLRRPHPAPAPLDGRRAARGRADARPPRGRRGDARDDGDAVPGHEPAGDRLGAADRHDHDPPRRGARAPAAGPDGRDHHLHRRRLQARLRLRLARRPRAGGVGRRVPQRAARRHGPGRADAALAARGPDAAADRGRVHHAPRARLHRARRDRRGDACMSTAPRGCCRSTASRTSRSSTR